MAMLRIPVTSRDHIRGAPEAPVTLVEYGDYECPYCSMAHPIVREVLRHFGDRLRFVFRHFALAQVHRHAESAAETAELAGAHSRFWQMHDALYENQDQLGLPLYFMLAEALGIPAEEVREALEKGIYAPRVRADLLGGARSGVNGTPTFFINGQRHDDAYDFGNLVAAIDEELEMLRAGGG